MSKGKLQVFANEKGALHNAGTKSSSVNMGLDRDVVGME